MKKIYLREKKSGNFELSNKSEATHKFKTQKEFKEWYDFNITQSYRGVKIIKATYRLSQTYFYDANEVLSFIKKNNIF